RMNFSAAGGAASALCPKLNDSSSPERPYIASQTLVPQDAVSGVQLVNVQIYWGTDEGTAGRAATFNVYLDRLNQLASPASNVTLRGTASPTDPAQGVITTTTISSLSGAVTYAPGDIIQVNIERDPADSNAGNVYVYGVAITYTSSR